jgi:HEAT repeat protein
MARVAQEAVPALTVLLGQPLDEYRERSLIVTLGEIGSAAAQAVPVMIRLLARDPATVNIWTRLAIIESLGEMGSTARPAIPALISELKTIKSHHQGDIRAQARSLATVIRALAFVDGKDPQVSAALRTQLASDDADASSVALDVLLQLSPDSPEYLAELLNQRPLGGSPRPEGWILAIARMTCDRQDAIGPLTDALRVGDSVTRKAAAWVLGTLGSEARSALPALQVALADWQNSLYEPRIVILDSVGSSIRGEISGWRRSRIWQSFFETGDEQRPRLGRQLSVRDVVREAILKIDSTADLFDTESSP